MKNGNGQSLPLTMAEPMAIVLPVGQWNTILTIVSKAPWDIADPIMQAIRAQIIEPRFVPQQRGDEAPIADQ